MRIPGLIFLALSIVGCQQPELVEHRETIAGIDHTLWIVDPDPAAAKRSADAVFSELRLLSKFTHPVQSKPMARVNVLLRSREWFSVNPSLAGIIQNAGDYYDKTGGLYNPPGLGALHKLLGLYENKPGRLQPKQQDLQQLLDHLPTMKDIEFETIRLRGNNSRIHLDFDWLAYGYAIDMQLRHLQELGIKNARLRIHQVEMTMGKVPGSPNLPGQARCDRTVSSEPDRDNVFSLRSGQPETRFRKISARAFSASEAAVACRVLLVAEPGSRQQLVEQLRLIEATLIRSDGESIRLVPVQALEPK